MQAEKRDLILALSLEWKGEQFVTSKYASLGYYFKLLIFKKWRLRKNFLPSSYLPKRNLDGWPVPQSKISLQVTNYAVIDFWGWPVDCNAFKSMSILLYSWKFQTVDRVKATCCEYFIFLSQLDYSCQIGLLSERSLKRDESYSRIIFSPCASPKNTNLHEKNMWVIIIISISKKSLRLSKVK